VQAVERRDYQSLRGIVSDNISYVGPLNSFDRAEPYLKYLEHLNLPKFDIKKEFAHYIVIVTIFVLLNESVDFCNINSHI
jgi:hypothetical protein